MVEFQVIGAGLLFRLTGLHVGKIWLHPINRRYQAHLDGTLEMGGGNSTNLQFGIGSTGGGSVQLMQDSYCIVH
jgi:hypothetical protein